MGERGQGPEIFYDEIAGEGSLRPGGEDLSGPSHVLYGQRYPDRQHTLHRLCQQVVLDPVRIFVLYVVPEYFCRLVDVRRVGDAEYHVVGAVESYPRRGAVEAEHAFDGNVVHGVFLIVPSLGYDLQVFPIREQAGEA